MDRLRLILSPDRYSKPQELADDAPLPPPSSNGGDKVSDDVINQVDEFLYEAIRTLANAFPVSFLRLTRINKIQWKTFITSYRKYMQRFDPEFGFNGGLHTMQPMYTAVLNCNTSFHSLDPLMDCSFLLNTTHNHYPGIYPGHGLLHHLLEWDMDIQRPYCHHLILEKLVHTLHQLSICIHLSILVSVLECLLFLANLFTSHLHSFFNHNLMQVLGWPDPSEGHGLCLQLISLRYMM